MIGVLFLCWIAARSSLSQTVTWTVETAVPRFNEPLKLTCTVSSGCCTSSFRIWEDASGTQIMNNGMSPDPAKYVEDWDGGTTDFSLIINNLDINDTGKDYDCRYSFGSDKHTLSQDATWEYAPEKPEQCPFKWKSGKIEGRINIARTAPFPTVVAYFGDRNMTSDLMITQLTNFETWFYSLTVSIDTEVTCQNGETFTLIVYTGTKETKICDHDNICKPNCYQCGGKSFAWGSLGMILGLNLVFICYVLGFSCCQPWCYARKLICCKFKKPGDYSYSFYGKEYTKEEVDIRTTLFRAVVVTVICYLVYYSLVSLFIIGIFCSICANDNELYSMLFGFGSLTFMCTFHWTIKHFNDEYSLRQWLTLIGLVLLINLIIPIPFLIVYYRLHDDDSSLKQCLRYIGLVLLATLIFPIPFLIIYYYLKDNKGDDQSANTGIEMRKDGKLVKDATSEHL